MTDSTHAKIPVHLRKYIVRQNYERYTPEDQAVWRYILRQLKNHLSTHAHSSYLDGLVKTGISIDRIPSIDSIDEHLEKSGWGAVPVSGFIPPAAFMEFQSLGILPIASDMRSLAHLQYTPAPDIVHEAAGHAPFLADPEYAAYLKHYGETARNAIISSEDLRQYEAIRHLSDLKEDPRSTPAEIARAEADLNAINASIKGVSEAALLSRMNWWTAEYGLIGDPASPRIFGAGLLSSVGESRSCLGANVKKIPLSVDCVNFSYDITEPQPQLFVAKSFAQLSLVLEDLAKKMSYRLGGVVGLERALDAATVNSVQLDSGLQISGQLKAFQKDAQGQPCHLQFAGPVQLSRSYHEWPGQGTERHAHGFSSPVGRVRGLDRELWQADANTLRGLGLEIGKKARLEYTSGIVVEGVLKSSTFADGQLILLTWTDCKVTHGDTVLFDPAWGEYDMAVGTRVVSVFGGPADRSRFGRTEDFVAARVPERTPSAEEQRRYQMFTDLRQLRESPPASAEPARAQFRKLCQDYLQMPGFEWLPGVELVELSHQLNLGAEERDPLLKHLNPDRFRAGQERQSVIDGLMLANQRL